MDKFAELEQRLTALEKKVKSTLWIAAIGGSDTALAALQKAHPHVVIEHNKGTPPGLLVTVKT